MSTEDNWPDFVTLNNAEEMQEIKHLLPTMTLKQNCTLMQSFLDWASCRTSVSGSNGYRIKTHAQLMLTIAPDAFVQCEESGLSARWCG